MYGQIEEVMSVNSKGAIVTMDLTLQVTLSHNYFLEIPDDL